MDPTLQRYAARTHRLPPLATSHSPLATPANYQPVRTNPEAAPGTVLDARDPWQVIEFVPLEWRSPRRPSWRKIGMGPDKPGPPDPQALLGMPFWLRDGYGPSLMLQGMAGTVATPDPAEIAAAAAHSGVDAQLLLEAYRLNPGAAAGPHAPGARERRYDLVLKTLPVPPGARPAMTWGCPICEAHVYMMNYGASFHGLPGNLGWRSFRNGPTYDELGWFPPLSYEKDRWCLPDPYAKLRIYHEAAIAADLPHGPTDMALIREITLKDPYLVPRPELIKDCPFTEPKPLELF
jgi:hypothetical protein